MDVTLGLNLASNGGLKHFGKQVRNQFGINGTISLIDAEHRLFKRSPAFFWGDEPSANSDGAKGNLISLNHINYCFSLRYG